MAAPITLTSATTAEGQLVMLVEGLVNLQGDTTADTGTNRDGITIVTSNAINDITGTQTITLSVPVSTTSAADGFTTVADEVYYPKVV